MVYSGPAYESGIIKKGDILCEVDGTLVLRCTTSRISTYLLGPKDSLVTKVFLRGNKKIVARLARQVPITSRSQGIQSAGSGQGMMHSA